MSNGKVLQVVMIPVEKISYQVDENLKRFQQLGTEVYVDSIKELAASIKAVGLLNPIQVIKGLEGYFVAAGNRRLAACKLIGMTEIPCFVKSESNFLIAFSEQVLRTDLTEIERGSWIDKAVTHFEKIEPFASSKSSTKDIIFHLSKMLGKAPRTLQQWRSMSKKFTPEEKARVLAGESAYAIGSAKAAVSDEKLGRPADPEKPVKEPPVLTAEQIAEREAKKAEKEKGKLLNKKASAFISQSEKIRETITFIAENALEFKTRKNLLGAFKALQKAMAVLEIRLAKDKPLVSINRL